MTKEELKLEAIKYLENFKDCANCRNRWGDCADQLDEYCLENDSCFATPKEQDIYLAGAEPREKRIAELEQENAELRLLKDVHKVSSSLVSDIAIEKQDQLTKAKKIIKDLLGSENTCCEEEMFFEIRQKAENFLKESEVEK